MTRTPFLLVLLTAVSCAGLSTRSKEDEPEELTPIETRVADWTARPGLFDLYLEEDAGKAWLVLPPADDEGVHATCLYYEGLTTGLGSNPVGLDRGQVRGPWLVRFRSLGAKLLVERPNLDFRANSDDPEEVRATAESFATSVLWSTDRAERDPDGSVLIDLTSFLVRDAHGVTRTLEADGGSWRLDPERSAVDAGACLAFPDNLELEALLTFGGSSAGRDTRSVTPDASSVTLTQHHSLIRLPDDGYTPRDYDPRAGAFAVSYLDYAAPLTEQMEVAYAVRHRLQKQDPRAARSKPVEPIVYYVDRGAPEPVRSALIEGASWWATAFEKAGFEDAFRVEVLPEGAHPLDVRYNVIQWVHRSSRGWSYGNAVSDPRTGEILKGHVSLGSLRVRQDRLLFEGLAGTARTGSGHPDDPIELALARIRQLAAHEVGHTLGFAHNFSASTFDRGSVMDYPAPLIQVRPDGTLDFSEAYDVGIGAWDEVAVAWLYSEFGTEQESDALKAILAEASARGMRYHSDTDARPAGAAQPYANLWDNFADPVTGLRNALQVRGIALGRFGEENLSAGRPRAHLEEVLAPLYFHHRYQIDAAVKVLGGLDFDHVIAGEGAPGAVPPSPQLQKDALAALRECLTPGSLDIPESALRLLGPRPPGVGANREQFATQTAPQFDALGAAATVAHQVVGGVLQRERCARLVDQHRRAGDQPSLESVLESLTDQVFGFHQDEERLREIQREVQTVLVRGLISLAEDARAAQRVRSRVSAHLGRLIESEVFDQPRSEADHAHYGALRRSVERHLHRNGAPAGPLPAPQDPPPGSPIGAAARPVEFCGCAAQL